jgi:hypothetical protein
MYKSIHDPYRSHYDRTDSRELDHRLENLRLCNANYFTIHYDIYDLEMQAKRFDINRVCRTEVEDLKKFALETGLRYENVYQSLPTQNSSHNKH